MKLFRTTNIDIVLRASPVTKAQTKSSDYALHSCFRKIFSTMDQVVIHHCMVFFISLLFLKQ